MNNPETNRRNAIEFYRLAFNGNPIEATKLYVGSVYIQHNPGVKSGIQGFIDYFTGMHLEYPDKSIEFVRSVAEGDLVALQTYQLWPGEEYVTMDFFRFDENGKISEHWDAVQKIPDISQNSNKMY